MATAGSPTSPLLSQALAMAGDGVSGATLQNPDLTGVLPEAMRGEDLEKMNPAHRQTVLRHELLKDLSFKPTANIAELKAIDNAGDEKTLVTLDRRVGDDYKHQLGLVFAASQNRPDRMSEMFVQQTDILSFFGLNAQLGYVRKPWTMVLIDAVLAAAIDVHTQFKHALPVLRPVELSPQINPVIQTPSHSSFPSGHATEAFVVAQLLTRLRELAEDSLAKSNLLQHAVRIAQNRTVAGVHYPVDNMAGSMLGTALADYFSAISQPGVAPVAVPKRSFKPSAEKDHLKNFTLTIYTELLNRMATKLQIAPTNQTKKQPLNWIWSQARSEWP
ncbi:phosphatase PAP2 family protein [uncultured Tateyamaria sp.]|uniref:phosphatase PAP2 family protein n=1 Tax=uncultured Tateyamaria sp. TaxID=455651 RepID=UPI0026378190|nr:phosphatase PAP2 family protein [uncultured Tateyamaria sp.]